VTTVTAGVIEQAVQAYHPTSAVLFEASALDRELLNPARSWGFLLRAIESFATHYPAVLLKSPAAMMELGKACILGVLQAQGNALRTRAAALLETLLSGVIGEVIREGPGTIERQVPEGMRLLVEDLKPQPDVEWEYGHLLPPLQALGRQVLMVAEDSSHPEAWYDLLGVLTQLLLSMSRKKVEGEPIYDGRWDHSKAADMLEVGELDAVRREKVEKDLAWLDELQRDLTEGKRPGVDVFLELSAYVRRDERESVWGTWFQAVAAKSLSGELSAGMLRKLCMGIADQIEQVRDRRFLSKLAAIVRRVVPEVAAANREAGLRTALDTIGKAIVTRLDREAGSGDLDEVFWDLGAGVGELVRRLMGRADASEVDDILELGIRASTGPLAGRPVDGRDVIWRLTVAAEHQQVADRLLLSLLVGFSLEDVLLRDNRRPGRDERTVGESLAGMLGREWEPQMLHLVRAVLRVTPLSPFHVGSATTRAHLMALDPEERQDCYLHDLREQILARGGADSIKSVESVLDFWRTGEVEHLDNLISPESLAALPAQARDEHLEHIRMLLEGLNRHVPVKSGQDKAGVRWLAHMPEAFYDVGTLLKVAGFSGCSGKAVALLNHLLQLYRALVQKYQQADRAAPDRDSGPEVLLQQSSRLLQQRRDLLGKLFSSEGLSGVEPTRRLEFFNRELTLLRTEDGCLEELANRALAVLDRNQLPLAGQVLGHLLVHACLSGLGTGELEAIANDLAGGQFVEADFFKLLSRAAWQVASVRNRLAESLQPHVEASTRRLLSNPLSCPAAAYAGLFDFHRLRGAERLTLELGGALLEDLLSADGSFLLLEDFIHRLMHLIERY
jgi:hypothetical protein